MDAMGKERGELVKATFEAATAGDFLQIFGDLNLKTETKGSLAAKLANMGVADILEQMDETGHAIASQACNYKPNDGPLSQEELKKVGFTAAKLGALQKSMAQAEDLGPGLVPRAKEPAEEPALAASIAGMSTGTSGTGMAGTATVSATTTAKTAGNDAAGQASKKRGMGKSGERNAPKKKKSEGGTGTEMSLMATGKGSNAKAKGEEKSPVNVSGLSGGAVATTKKPSMPKLERKTASSPTGKEDESKLELEEDGEFKLGRKTASSSKATAGEKIRQQRFVCDVCKVKWFLDFQEACDHEKKCGKSPSDEDAGGYRN